MKATQPTYHSSKDFFSAFLKRLSLIFILLIFSRIGLYVLNYQLFTGFSFLEILKALLVGIRFDLSIFAMISALFILGNTIPFKFRQNKLFQSSINTITLVLMIGAIFFNFSDAIYYRFTLKRMTFDIFSYLKTMNTFWEIAPRFLIDFWYVVLLAVGLILLMIYGFIRLKFDDRKTEHYRLFYVKNSLIFIASAILIIIFMRGGFQLKPINIVDASLHAPAPLSPIVLNTPFTIIKSFGQTGLKVKSDFSEEELENIYVPIKSYQAVEGLAPQHLNVVVLILESFSSEHIGYLSHQKTYTPFLDSLFEHSLVFPGIANGKRSIEGIPAILSALPTLSDESFLNGAYAANQIEGLASSLNKHHYQTSFYHGGKNGTMSFDSYASAAGFKNYYGKNEYPYPENYDGHWGIWDEPYLQYFGEELSHTEEPFMAALFTLSSHHPYQVPEKFAVKFPQGTLEIQQSIAYTDYSLKRFFDLAKSKDWYRNTLFIITADHTSEGAHAEYQNSLGQFSIPIAFYAPGDSLLKMRSQKPLVQQIDIYPSIMHYLGMEDPFIAFGNSVFDDSSPLFAVNFFNQKLQWMDSLYLLQYEEDHLKSVFSYRCDSLLKINLKDKLDVNKQVQFKKAFIQQYNNRMINNQLRVW